FLSLSLTKTSFSPFSAHFLVHSAALAFAPLAPHFSSLTQPRRVISLGAASLVVSVFLALSDLPISSCFMVFCAKASTEQASTSAHRFRNTFLMTLSFDYGSSAAECKNQNLYSRRQLDSAAAAELHKLFFYSRGAKIASAISA